MQQEVERGRCISNYCHSLQDHPCHIAIPFSIELLPHSQQVFTAVMVNHNYVECISIFWVCTQLITAWFLQHDNKAGNSSAVAAEPIMRSWTRLISEAP
jgi:hypothetical protein